MSTLGDTLRGERLRRGLAPEEIAAQIKIAPYMVEAMETGRFDRLPSGSYRRAFLRQYAHVLGVDEHEIVATFKEEYGEPEVPLPVPRVKRRAPPIALVWVTLAAATFAGVYKVRPNLRLDLPRFGDGKATPAQTAVHAAVTPAQPPGTAPELAAPEVAPEPATPTPQSPSEVRPAAETSKPVRVELTASEPVWVSVHCDGLATYRGMIETSAAKEFGASSKVTILVGNSGGLAISLNGQTVGPFGTRREIQLVELTAQGARLVPRRRPPAAAASEEEPGAI